MVSLISDFHMHLSQTFVLPVVLPGEVLQTPTEEEGKTDCSLPLEEGAAKMMVLDAADPSIASTSAVLSLPWEGSMMGYC